MQGAALVPRVRSTSHPRYEGAYSNTVRYEEHPLYLVLRTSYVSPAAGGGGALAAPMQLPLRSACLRVERKVIRQHGQTQWLEWVSMRSQFMRFWQRGPAFDAGLTRLHSFMCSFAR